MALHIQQIACGRTHSLVLLSDGSVWAAGFNYYGQLGDGIKNQNNSWKSVMATGSGVIQVAAGGDHSLALKSDGSVWTTGYNLYGQLGNGTKMNKTTWTSVIPFGVTRLAAGYHYSLAIKSDGSLWAVGGDGDGQMGNGKRCPGSKKSTWISVIPSGVTQVAAGGMHSLALKADGSVWATGSNGWGQLGDGATTKKSAWIAVISSGVTQVAAGGWYSLALKSDGSVWATGHNEYGQLGDGTTTSKSTWISVIPSGVTQVAAGAAHSLALKSDGTLWKAGDNKCGQLGQEGAGSTVWIPDRFFETLLLESLLIDPPRSRRKLSETDSTPDTMPDAADDWCGFSL